MQIKMLFLILFFFGINSNNIAYGWWWTSSDKKAGKSRYFKSIGVANKVTGNVFIFKKNRMEKMKKGSKVYKDSEIITEEGAQISFSDYYDHKFHLSGSGHIKFMGKIMKLKRGYLWVQSYKKKGNFILKTANAQVKYNYGEFIFSFDENTGRSQILSIGGQVFFNNPNQSYDKIRVEEGQFSFVHDSYSNGTPRGVTFIGEKSFQKILSLFKGIRPMRTTYYSPKYKNKKRTRLKRQRGIASIDQTQEILDRRGYGGSGKGLVIIKQQLKNARKSVMKIYQEKLKQMRRKLPIANTRRGYREGSHISSGNIQKNRVKINIYRSSNKSVQRKQVISPTLPTVMRPNPRRLKIKTQRAVASLPSVKKSPIEQKTFEKSLKKAYRKQPRHKSEVNQLIMELDNYKKNYQVDY